MSFDICSRSDLPHRLFVEASAGTGKTFLIEHYIVKKVLSGSFEPKRLVLVTFTKAVARELRLRLRKTLEATHGLIIGGTSETAPEYLRPIIEQESFFRRKAARTIEEAIDRLHEATISTIHGFCDHLLQLWEKASGGGAYGEWISAEQQKQWLEEFIQEGGGLTRLEFEALSRRYRFEPGKLIALLMDMMDDPHEAADAAWDEAKKAAETVRSLNIPNIASALEAKARAFCNTTTKDGSLKPDVLAAFAAVQRCVEEGITEEALEPLFHCSLADCFSKPLKRRVAVPPESEQVAQRILNDLWPHLEQLTETAYIAQRLGARCTAAFREYLTRCGGKTPEAVVRRVVSLSSHEPFVALAAKHVDTLIVDEFQDTDQAQYQIFSNLFLNNPSWQGCVLFVGDPKQAIYSFRKADVYSYLQAKETLAAHEQRTLTVNYRADPAVVEAQNLLFANPDSRLFFLPKTQSTLSVLPSQPGKSVHEPIGDGRGAIHLPICHGSLGRKRRWPHADLENDTLFPWIADEMISLDRLGIPFSRQAILIKDKYQAERIRTFLEGRHIPTCAWRIDSVVESPIFHWLQKAFFLALRPTDQRRLSSLLLAIPSSSHIDLCRSIASDRRLDEWALCVMAWKQVQEAFSRGGIGAMARSLFSCLWDGRQTVEEWVRFFPRGGEWLIDLEHLFELLALLEGRLPRSLEAYHDALQDLPKFFSDEPEALTRRADPADEGSPILTMHRSKGLEFDVVYALGGASRTSEESLSEEVDAEKLRQLYVTVTRAKRRCYIPLLIEDDQRPIAPATASPIELLFASLARSQALYAAMTPDHLLEQAQRLVQSSPTITRSDMGSEQRGYTLERKTHAPPAILSPLAIQTQRRSYESFSSVHADESFPPFSAPSGRCIGASFHAAIARLLFAPAPSRSSPKAIESWLGIKDPELASLLFQASRISLPLHGPDRTISLESIPRMDMRAECGFLDAMTGERFARGVIDLIFVWNGKVYIIDWKTHACSDQSPEEIVDQAYGLQRQMYQEAVTKAFLGSYEYGGCFFVFVRQLPHGIVKEPAYVLKASGSM